MVVRILPSWNTGRQHFGPDSDVAETNYEEREDEVDADDGHSEDRVAQIVEDAGVGARIILDGADVHVGQDSQDSHDPGDNQVDAGIAHTEDPFILEAVADVAVTVDSDGHYVEDGTDHTQPCDEPNHLALELAQIPAPNGHGMQHQRVGVDGHQHVSHREADHKDVAWKTWREERRGKTENKWLKCGNLYI